MSLDSALSVATSSLSNIALGYTLISQNVANASTPGYAAESETTYSLDAGGLGFGAEAGPTQVATNASLQTALYAQNAASSAAQTYAAALGNLQAVQGAVGSGTDLGSLLTNLQNGFTALQANPADQTQQTSVVNAATAVTQQINTLAASFSGAEQAAQNSLVTQVGQLNTALGQLGQLNTQIIALQGQGGSTADLQNQRNQVLTTISGLTSVNFISQANGNILVYTTAGTQLPTDTPNPLSLAPATTGPTVYYPGGGLPGIELDGTDVTASLTGGSIGANITLRDTTLPTYLGTLDGFAQGLASRFAAQGLSLFTDPAGNVPAQTGASAQSGFVGFSADITVNPAVVANPALVVNGNLTIAGSPTGATAFTPNPTGQAGFTGLIDRVLSFALGDDVQAGVGQPAIATTGLGPAGNLNADFSGGQSLQDFATAQTAGAAQDSNTATTAQTEAAATQTTLGNNLRASTGVDIDSQLANLVQLQNAYAANAKIISTVQSLYAILLNEPSG